MSKAALNGLDPLKELLGDVLNRLEALEAKVGIKSASSLSKQPSKSNVTPGAALLNGKSRDQRIRFRARGATYIIGDTVTGGPAHTTEHFSLFSLLFFSTTHHRCAMMSWVLCT